MNTMRIRPVAPLALLLPAGLLASAHGVARGSPLQQPVVFDAGTLQVASGTWLPPGTELPGTDVIYNNTGPCPYAAVMSPGEEWFDAGNVPSTTHPAFGSFAAGCADQYLITGFQIGYCTDMPSVDLRLRFFDQMWIYSRTWAGNIVTLDLPGMPGSPASSTWICWTATVDLRGSGLEFVLLADGDGTYDGGFGDSNNAQFGYSMQVTNLTGSQTGPLFGGDPGGSYAGTRWSRPSVDYGADGAGRWNAGEIGVNSPTWPGGGISWDIHFCQGFHLRLYADACGVPAGAPFCTGTGTAPCPCANTSPTLNREGCRNSLNGVNGGRLEGTGTASLSADTVRLTALRLPPNTSALFFQGTTQVAQGMGSVFGDGLRCAGGEIRRLATVPASGLGEAAYPTPGGNAVSAQGLVGAPGTRTYQCWYRNGASFCTPATFNLTNGWEIPWVP